MSNQIYFLSQAPKKVMNKDQTKIVKDFIHQLNDFGVWDISTLYKQYQIWISKTQNIEASGNYQAFKDVIKINMFASQACYKFSFYRKRPMSVMELPPYYADAIAA